jgi:uncharacterized protein YprB with RNaseH-like and TPR domain
MIVEEGKVPAILKGTVIDIETTGISAYRDSLITVGILESGVYRIYQATDGSSMLSALRPILHDLPRPIYAFNKAFEESFLGLTIDRELQLRPYESKNDAIRISGITDPLGNGRWVPPEWQAYERDGRDEHLSRIITHNLADLQYEMCLAIIRSWPLNSASNGDQL